MKAFRIASLIVAAAGLLGGLYLLIMSISDRTSQDQLMNYEMMYNIHAPHAELASTNGWLLIGMAMLILLIELWRWKYGKSMRK